MESVQIAQQRATGNNDLAILNRARRGRGLPAYKYDLRLTEVAHERASRQASRGRMSHVGGSFRPGRAEGVSMSTRGNPVANACYAMSSKYSVAGAFCVKGSNGRVYCSLVLR